MTDTEAKQLAISKITAAMPRCAYMLVPHDGSLVRCQQRAGHSDDHVGVSQPGGHVYTWPIPLRGFFVR